MVRPVNEKLSCPACLDGLTHDAGTESGGTNGEKLLCKGCGRSYWQNGDYVDFLNEGGLVFRNRREKFFRSVVARIYTPVTNMMFLACGGSKNARNEVMGRLKIKQGDDVLETGIGYGENLLWLERRVKNLAYYGMDIQKEMLSHCVRNLRRWNIRAELARADAQSLPYGNNAFDVVFHLGAINLFDDKGKAIREMIRVAKPGSHIVIADETEKAGRLFNIFTGGAEKVVPPVDMVPPEMKNISLNTIWKGYGYVIEFDVVKPML